MKVWLYYRLSRDEDKELNSLTNQKEILVDYCESHGYTIIGESFDDNVSGMRISKISPSNSKPCRISTKRLKNEKPR